MKLKNPNFVKRFMTAYLPKKNKIGKICPKCKFEPMIKVNKKYNCEMCGYISTVATKQYG